MVESKRLNNPRYRVFGLVFFSIYSELQLNEVRVTDSTLIECIINYWVKNNNKYGCTKNVLLNYLLYRRICKKLHVINLNYVTKEKLFCSDYFHCLNYTLPILSLFTTTHNFSSKKIQY